MKKLTIALLALVMTFAFAACSSGASDESTEPAGQNAIAELYANENLSCGMTTYDENSWKGIFYSEDYSEVQLAEAKWTKEDYDKSQEIDFSDESGEQQLKDLLCSVKDVTVTDITDKVPTQETLDSWIGKKCGDLEDAGFYESGNTFDENTPGSLEIYYDGPEYCVAVGFDKKLDLKIDDLSANDIRALKIETVRMTALGDGLME